MAIFPWWMRYVKIADKTTLSNLDTSTSVVTTTTFQFFLAVAWNLEIYLIECVI